MTQEQLAEAMTEQGEPADQSQVSRWEKGQNDIGIEQVAAFERAAGRHRGFVFVTAGYVDLPTTARQAIEVDPALTDPLRDSVLLVYDAALSRSAELREESPSSFGSISPAKREKTAADKSKDRRS